MKLRKLFALLMTAVMLLGMVPASHAELTDCYHDYDSGQWLSGAPANCQVSKPKTYTCTICNDTWTRNENGPCNYIWSWGSHVPSCEENGLQNGVCSVCGEVTEREARGPHSWGDWEGNEGTCLEPGREERSCYYCGATEYRNGSIGAHDWGDWEKTKTGTCVEAGEEERTCNLCGKTETRTTAMGEHQWGNWVATKPGTCVQVGEEERTCSVCGKTETRTTGGGGHKYGEYEIVKGPKCTEPGRKEHYCEYCGRMEWGSIPATGHDMGSWYVFEAPQVGLPGIERRDCLNECGYFETREIPALEQDFDNVVINPGDVNVAPGGPGELPDDYQVPASFTYQIINTDAPVNGSHYVPGELISFKSCLTNTSDSVTLIVDKTAFASTSGNGTFVIRQSHHTVLEPGESLEWSHSNLVTEQNMTLGYIERIDNVYLTDEYGVEHTATDSIRFPCGPGELPDDYVPPVNPDIDEDGIPNEEDPDIDGDGIPNGEDPDVDGDGVPNGEDPDVDGDGVPNGEDPDKNGDGIPDGDDPDVDGDGIPNEEDPDMDGDGIPNGDDPDVDGDGIPNGDDPDVDGDGIPNEDDPDVDGDGIPNEEDPDYKPAAGLTVDKTYTNTPANGEFFVPGETICFIISMSNDTTYPLYNVTLTDPLCEDQYFHDEVNGMSYLYMDNFDSGDDPQGYSSAQVAPTYVVTEADAEAGFVTNTAIVHYQTWYGENKTASASVTVKCGKATDDGDMGLSGAMTFTKEVTRAPQNGLYFTPGEYIRYTFTLTNTGNVPLVDIGFVDAMLGTTAWDPLAVGETSTWDCYYEVTDLDAAAGSVENIAYVNAFDADENQYVEYSNNVTAPCGFPEGEDPFGVLTGLDITKAVESLPLNGSYYTEGETVAYKITYANSGELPLTDVMIYDAMGGMSEIATAETLNPGESRVCWFNYAVTAADVTRGYIANTAIGQFELNGYVNTVNSNTVTVDTNGKQDLWTVHPFWPGEDPEYDPGTGWFPDGDPTPEGALPPFGTIDTDKLRSGDSYCKRTITGRDNASASYEISFCAEHADTQSSALLMQQAAATPELQAQAATYAVALWRTEVEALYQEIYEAADPQAKMVVMTEYVRFLTELANYEALLNRLYPGQTTLVAQMVAAMWEDKCVTLCYEMHADAAERTDNLLSVTPAAGAASAVCDCVTTNEVNAAKAYTQHYCPMHGFTFSMIDALLKGQDTAEAWAMVRQIWGVELTNAYNQISAKLGENKALAMAEYNALTQWMMAREASLMALYPENPEIVAQTMVKIIIDRVNALCQNGK